MELTVAVPALDEERYIGRCLESLKNQRYGAPFEIIVAIGPCRDNTEAVVREFAEREQLDLKCVGAPRGVALARQAAFTAASGEVIASADADAHYPPDWLERIANNFKEHPDAVVVYGPVFYRNFSGETGAFLTHIYPHIDVFMCRAGRLLGLLAVRGANFAVKRAAFRAAGGFDESLEVFEDYELAMRLKRQGKVIFDAGLIAYRSTRRYQQMGIIGTFLHYARPYVKTFILHK